MKRAERVVGGGVVLAFIAAGTLTLGWLKGKAEIRKSLQHGKSLALVLRMYADDHDGEYPTGEDANECFAKLVAEI